MAEPTLEEVFGDSATQDETTLVISKADLFNSVGLISLEINTAESLLVAIVLQAAKQLNDTAQEQNKDIQVTINKGFDSLVTRNNQNYRQYQYTIEMQKLDTATAPNPADF